MRVVLTGFMGTGKSAVGRRVAERLGRRLVDTDVEIERIEGMPVREIFARSGEARFRELERRVVAESCNAGDVVIATGGGTILDAGNRSALADGALMVCLGASPETIARRVRAYAADRPLLAGARSLTARIRELLDARQSIYAAVPLQIDTSKRTIEQVADTIVAALSAAEQGVLHPRRESAAGESAAAKPGSTGGGRLPLRRPTERRGIVAP